MRLSDAERYLFSFISAAVQPYQVSQKLGIRFLQNSASLFEVPGLSFPASVLHIQRDVLTLKVGGSPVHVSQFEWKKSLLKFTRSPKYSSTVEEFSKINFSLNIEFSSCKPVTFPETSAYHTLYD